MGLRGKEQISHGCFQFIDTMKDVRICLWHGNRVGNFSQFNSK